MKVNVKIFILALLLPWLWNACSDDEVSLAYDPTRPISITGFAPDTGGYRSDFILEGENFGTDLSKIKVFFNDKEALLMNSKGNVIYCMVPKQPGDKNKITVQVEDQKATYEEKEFVYEIRANVTTVTGKAKEPGGTDGTIAEATFNTPAFLIIDDEDNLYVSELSNRRSRWVSLKQNKVITLQTVTYPDQAVFNHDKAIMYFMGDSDETLYRMDASTQWTLEVVGKISHGPMAYYHSVVFNGNDENCIYTCKNTGEFLRIDLSDYLAKGQKVSYKNVTNLGYVAGMNKGENHIMVYNPKDKYIYCAGHNSATIYRIKLNEDGTQAEFSVYAGNNGIGWMDGDVKDAKFNAPRGLALDQAGENLYIADVANHCIRKIDLNTNIVSTIAGQHGQAGYKDGDPETEALFKQPWGLCMDVNDYLYVADYGNYCVRKIAIE